MKTTPPNKAKVLPFVRPDGDRHQRHLTAGDDPHGVVLSIERWRWARYAAWRVRMAQQLARERANSPAGGDDRGGSKSRSP